MNWIQSGTAYTRDFFADGLLDSYFIDLDQPPIDRWALFFNDKRIVDNIYYLTDAKLIARRFDETGILALPNDLRGSNRGDHPRLYLDGVMVQQKPPLGKDASLTPVRALFATRNVLDAGATLLDAVKEAGIEPDRTSTDWSAWNSGIYCLLDAVFSARSKYEVVVRPLLEGLRRRYGMEDVPERTFSDFIADVDKFGPDKFGSYAYRVMNRQYIGRRLKVEVAYDAARYLAKQGLETRDDLRRNPDAENIVISGMRNAVVGIGPAISNYFMAISGNEDFVKVDVMICRFFERVGLGVINPMNDADYKYASATVERAAILMATTPARLDKAIWKYESQKSAG